MRIAAYRTLALPLALAGALVAFPAQRSARAQVTLAGEPITIAPAKMAGIYRVVLSGPSLATQRMHLLILLGDAGYTCVLISGEREMPIEDVKLEGDVIRGKTPTSLGKGDVTLTITEDGLSGSLTIGKTKVAITGERVG